MFETKTTDQEQFTACFRSLEVLNTYASDRAGALANEGWPSGQAFSQKKHCCLGIVGPGSGFTPPDGPIAYQDARFRSQDHLSQSLFSDSNMSCGRFLKRYQGF